MGTKGKKEPPAAADPVRAVGNVVGLGVGVTVGIATATTGLVAGVPAPDVLLRAVCAGVALKVAAGFGGALIARSMMRKPEAAKNARPEGDR